MKVLLINSNRFHQPWPVIPFGLCCVAAAVEQAGHLVKVLDLCFSRHPEITIRKTLLSFEPDAVGVSIRNIDNGVGYNTLFLLDEVRDQVIKPCKELFHGPIVIGGPAVGVSGCEMLDYFDLEYAIRGDGEGAMVEFLERLRSKTPLQGLSGLIIRKNGRIIQDPDPFRMGHLDDLPKVEPGRYVDVKTYAKYNSPLQIQTKRGCALRCTYCTYNRIEGHHYRLRDPVKVADEIERLVTETGIRRIEFTDSTFNIPLGHAKRVLKALIPRQLDIDLRTMGLNPGAVDQELVDLMARAGFREVDLGAEAGCDAMLKSLGKNFTTADLLKAGQLLRSRNIPVTWYLLLGAPGETPETVRETFDTINRAAYHWDLINIAVGLRIYNGSPIADWARAKFPATATSNYLFPASMPAGSSIDLETLKRLTAIESFAQPNYFMYDQDENTPLWLLRLASVVLKRVAPRQPIWRLFILLRKLQQLSGVNRIKKALFVRAAFRLSP